MLLVTSMKQRLATWLGLFFWLLLILVVVAIFFSLFTDPHFKRSHIHKRSSSPENIISRASIDEYRPTSSAYEQEKGTKVIIVSYMRSGTTFTGRLFDMNDDALYVFEPLWYLCIRAVPAFKTLTYLNGTRRPSPPSCHLLGLEEVEHYLTCKMASINMGSLTQVWMKLSQKTNRFNLCGTSPECVEGFSAVCKASSVRVVKTIRLSIEELEPLMRKYPELKLIHLVRDPRGMLQSRIKMGEYYHRSPMITGAEICGDMLRNSRRIKQIISRYPDRILQTRYEDFAEDPVVYSKEIYSFLKVTLPEKVKRWVEDNTRASSDDIGPYGTTRANSSMTAYKWRKDIAWDIALAMDTSCRRVYKELGYIAVDSEHMLRDSSTPLRRR